jgi:hypothetical protein
MTKVFAAAFLVVFVSLLTSAPPAEGREDVFHFIFAGDTCFGESYNIPEAFRTGARTTNGARKNNGRLLIVCWTGVPTSL